MEQKNDMIKVLVVEPEKTPYVKEIESKLAAYQAEVGGYIQAIYPFDEPVAIICNEEGKMNGLPLNRGIRDEDSHLQDVIAGDFFICYAPVESERFLSMPLELEEKYLRKFESCSAKRR